MPIYEDEAGIIWLGTGGGVSRYDGKSFRNFKMSKSESPPDSVHVSIYQQRLPENSGLHNDVHAIIQDKTGNYGLAQEGIPSFLTEKHLPLLPIETAKLSLTFGV
jgi:hypothetical protein